MMKLGFQKRLALGAIGVAVALLASELQAAGIAGQGTWESTLQARDLDGNGVTDAFYDTSLNVTWLRDANINGAKSWDAAKTWADNLVVGKYSDWRLPTMIDTGTPGCNLGYAGGTDCGYNVQTKSGNTVLNEMAYLYYTTLGNKAYCDPATSSASVCNGPQAGFGLTNTGNFQNFQSSQHYWHGLQYAPDASKAWYFNNGGGGQEAVPKSDNLYATAVRPGDVASNPPPPARQPQTFGLFIGVQDRQGGAIPFPGDAEAKNLFGASLKQGYTSTLLTANVDLGQAVTKEQIRAELLGFRSKGMQDGDALILTISAHGGSLAPGDGKGVDIVALGNNLSDEDLYDLLLEVDPNGKIRKTTFLDACHGGGFWGSGDQFEADAKNLDDLKNIALFAAAGEYSNAYFRAGAGGFFGLALTQALYDNLPARMSAAELHVFLQSEANAISIDPNFPVFYEAAFGDSFIADPSLFRPYFVASADFDTSRILLPSAVPEPQTVSLLLAGIAGLWWCQRRSRSKHLVSALEQRSPN